MVSAVGYIESHEIKVARFGDNMRNVAVTDGDKVEAAIQFGWTVDYYGIGDLVAEMDTVTEEEIGAAYEDLQSVADLEVGNNDPDFFKKQVEYQLKIEIGLRRFLEKGNYNAFT